MTDRLRETLESAELRDNACTSAHCTHHPCHLFRKAADLIERQGKALRAVYDLCFQREQMMAGEPNPAFAAQLTTAEIRAALAQTHPQTERKP